MYFIQRFRVKLSATVQASSWAYSESNFPLSRRTESVLEKEVSLSYDDSAHAPNPAEP